MRKFICVLALFLATFASHAQAPDAVKASLFMNPVLIDVGFHEAAASATQSCIWFPLQHQGLYLVEGSHVTGYFDSSAAPCEHPEYKIEVEWLDQYSQPISTFGVWDAYGWEDVVTVPDQFFWPMNAEYMRVCYTAKCAWPEWELTCCETWKLQR